VRLTISLAAIALLVAAGGCFDTVNSIVPLVCSGVPGRECPHNYYCGADGYCYHDGVNPDFLQPLDMTLLEDLSYPVFPPDLAMPDLQVPLPATDLATPADLTTSD
jgi:hypothetical protein